MCVAGSVNNWLGFPFTKCLRCPKLSGLMAATWCRMLARLTWPPRLLSKAIVISDLSYYSEFPWCKIRETFGFTFGCFAHLFYKCCKKPPPTELIGTNASTEKGVFSLRRRMARNESKQWDRYCPWTWLPHFKSFQTEKKWRVENNLKEWLQWWWCACCSR